MKKILIISLGLFFFSGLGISGFAAELKIGYVNTIEVFNEYQRTKDQEEQLETKKEEVTKILQAKEKEIRDAQGKLEVLREDQREEEIKKLQAKMHQYRDLRQKELEGVQEKRDQMMRDIVEDIDQAIKDYAQKNNYDLIVNGNSVLYAPDNKDLTDEILKIINQAYGRRRRR